MRIGILHLSDLHIKKSIEDNSILRRKNKLIEKIKNQLLFFDKVFIVISGDLAFSGNKEEYIIFDKFLEEILQSINQYIKGQTFIIGIPGNHDCNFSQPQKSRNLIIDGLEKNNFKDLDEEIIDVCTEPQREYFDYQESNFFKGGNLLYKSKLLNIVDYQFEGINILFNCYNTSWISKLHEQAGKLSFPIDYYNHECFENQATLKINIIHHPINWQNDYSYRELRKFLNLNGDITLSGHEHQSDINKMIDINGNENIFIESAALQDSDNKQKSSFNLIDIDFDNKFIKVDRYNYEEGKYIKLQILNNEEFLSNRNKNGKGINLKPNFNKSLELLSGQYLHKRVEKIYLEEVFVSPYLRYTDEKTEKNKLISFDKILKKNEKFKIIINGEENSGKTTLLKKYFKFYHEKGFIPLIINGIDIEKTGLDYILKKLISDSIDNQYAKKIDIDTVDISKIILLIDDFHKCKLKEEHRARFSKDLNQHFNKIIYTTNNALIFNSITSENNFFNDYVNYTIIELSYELRYELISKWNILGESELIGNELLRKNESYDRQVKDFLGKNFLPQYPIIILTALQSIDSGNSSDQGFTFYYKYLIEEALKNGISNPENSQFYNYFLAEYCFFLFQEKIKNISKDSFETFYKEYSRKMKVTISFNDVFQQLIQAKIIKISNDFVSISYNYIYYYYVATYISSKLDTDLSIKKLIVKLIERLYIEEFSGIIIFLSQLNSNSFILDTLEEYTNKYFEEFKPATLSDDISEIDKLIENLPALILENSDIEQRRKKELKKREEAEEREKLADNDYLSKEYDIDEDLSTITLLNRFIRAIKTFEIFGQVIKKNWGAFDGDKKDSYVSVTFNLSMRILSAYFSYIKSNRDDLVDYIYYVADKREISSKAEIEKLAKGLIFQMASMTSFGLIKRVSNSISHKQLRETFNDVVNNNPTNSFKLIRLAILMDHFGTLPNEEINSLLTKDKNFNKYFLPKILLRNLVYQYLHLYEIPFDERTKICSIVGINIEEQRLIQASSKQKKK